MDDTHYSISEDGKLVGVESMCSGTGRTSCS